MPNTELEYMYRDGGNYKEYATVVLEGPLTPEEVTAIRTSLDSGEYFIAEQVGLENLRERWETHHEDLDHIWHELVAITPTGDAPTSPMTAAEFAAQFVDVEWDVAAADERLQEWIQQTPAGT